MSSGFLLYGSTGFVGDAIARLAVQRGLRPVIAGRNAARVKAQAAELAWSAASLTWTIQPHWTRLWPRWL